VLFHRDYACHCLVHCTERQCINLLEFYCLWRFTQWQNSKMLLAICEKKLAIFASTGNYFRLWRWPALRRATISSWFKTLYRHKACQTTPVLSTDKLPLNSSIKLKFLLFASSSSCSSSTH